MRFSSLVGWGITIYAVLYLVWSMLVIHGLAGNPLSRVITLGTLVIVAALATRASRYSTERDLFVYATGWVAVAIVLDALVAVPSAGWSLYSDWNLWVGYLLLFFTPLVVGVISKKHAVAQ